MYSNSDNQSASSKYTNTTRSKIEIIRRPKYKFQIRFNDSKQVSLEVKSKKQRIRYLSEKFTALAKKKPSNINILGFSLDDKNNANNNTKLLNDFDYKFKKDSSIECPKHNSTKFNLVLYALLDLINKKINCQEQHKLLVEKLKHIMQKEALISKELSNQSNKLSDSYAFSKIHAKQTVFTQINEILLKKSPRKQPLLQLKQIEFNQLKFDKDLNELTCLIINILIRLNLFNQKTIAHFQIKSSHERQYVQELEHKNELITTFLNCFNYSNFLNDSDLSCNELKVHDLFKSIYNSLTIQSELIISNDSLNNVNNNYMNKDLQIWLEYYELAKVFYKYFVHLTNLDTTTHEFYLFHFLNEFKLFMFDFVHVLKLESIQQYEFISCALSPIKVLIDFNTNSTLRDPRNSNRNYLNRVELNLLNFSNKKQIKNNLNESIQTDRINETLFKYKSKVDLLKQNEYELEKLITNSTQVNSYHTSYLTPMSSPNDTIFTMNPLNEIHLGTNLNNDKSIEIIDFNELMCIDFESFGIGVMHTSTQIKQDILVSNTSADQASNQNCLNINNELANEITNLSLDKQDMLINLDDNHQFKSINDPELIQNIIKDSIDIINKINGEEMTNNETSIKIISDTDESKSLYESAETKFISNSNIDINNNNISELLPNCDDFLNQSNFKDIKPVENYDINRIIGGKPILKIIPIDETNSTFLNITIDDNVNSIRLNESQSIELIEYKTTRDETNLNSLNNTRETIRTEPSRNLLKSIISNDDETLNEMNSFQLIKDSLKESAWELNKKIKHFKNRSTINDSLTDKSNDNDIVFFKNFQFVNNSEIKSTKRSLQFNTSITETNQNESQLNESNYTKFKLDINQNSTPIKPINTNNSSVDFLNSSNRKFIKKKHQQNLND